MTLTAAADEEPPAVATIPGLAHLATGPSVLPRHLPRLGRDSRIADISQIYGKTDANDQSGN